eukprot:Em0009g1214a
MKLWLLVQPSVASGFSFLLHTGIQFFSLPDVEQMLVQDYTAACALACSGGKMDLLRRETSACLQASEGASLIVFNLFTLEGYFIAQYLNVPCLAASPFLQTRTMPSTFEAMLSEAQPGLYKKLRDARHGEVSFAEVDHWMWRLFLNDFSDICEALHIPSLPFSTPTGLLPPPVPLLYGVSPLIVQRQSYWPNSVELTGYWTLPESLQEPPHPDLVSLLSTSQPLYIGFGSMEAYLGDINWSSILERFENVLKSFNLIGLFQCTPGGRVETAYRQLLWTPTCVRLWAGPLPHSWLFSRCCAVLHHGGSGTVATALLAKKPQVICPVMFDQQYWAEQLSWEGLAVQCPGPDKLTETDLTTALNVLFKSKMAETAYTVSSRLEHEDGVTLAVTRMEGLLREGRVET